jgi:tRNA dimethylallyltransferase
MNCLIAVVGPTAVGKSSLAMDIARKYGGEIINADSRQIYRYMDIGTAKPGRAERDKIFHHLLDIIDPNEQYSVALYQRSANSVISDIKERGKLPVMVGGSGQYIWSVIEGWQIPGVKPDLDFRAKMEKVAAEEGADALYSRLLSIDPEAAAKILPGNLRRVIRALEIYGQTGQKPSVLQTKRPVLYPVLIIGLTAERDKLYAMINDRTDSMMAAGFVEEVQKLLQMGYLADLPSMSSLGYRQIASYLSGEIELAEAVQKIKFETHRFARGQYAWFRLRDNRIKWFNVSDDIKGEIDYTIQTFLEAA